MYHLDIKEEVDRIFRKLSKKNSKLFRIIGNKIKEIRKNPNHVYKFLRKPLQGYNRVHIDNHFVLVFRIDHARETVVVYYFDHHDNVYKWRPHES
jgi:YafQ family addiction module toxin component